MMFDETIDNTKFVVQQVVVVRNQQGDPIGVLHIGRDHGNTVHVKVARYDNFAGNYKNRHLAGVEEGLRYGPTSYAEVDSNHVDGAAGHLKRLLRQQSRLMSCSCAVREWMVSDAIHFEVCPLEESTKMFTVLFNRAGQAQDVLPSNAQWLIEHGESLKPVLSLAEASILPSQGRHRGPGGAVCSRCGDEAATYWVECPTLVEWGRANNNMRINWSAPG